MFAIDWSIRASDIMVLFGLGGTCIYYATVVTRFVTRVETIEKDMVDLKDIAKKTSDVLLILAVQKERLDTISNRVSTLDQRVEDLRNGRGYIRDRDAKGVDRDY